MNSIETLELRSEGEWRTLPVNEKVQAFYHVGAVALKGSILVFGGYHNSEMCMMKFDEEGALLGDLSDDGLIPTGVCRVPFIVQGGRVFCVSFSETQFPRALVYEEKWANF